MTIRLFPTNDVILRGLQFRRNPLLALEVADEHLFSSHCRCLDGLLFESRRLKLVPLFFTNIAIELDNRRLMLRKQLMEVELLVLYFPWLQR